MLQGFFLFIIAQTIFAIHKNPAPLGYLDLMALLLWTIGFAWESIADRQLAQFARKTENKGKIIQEGLWKYSRHPNYFGEIIQWWAIFFMASYNFENSWTIISPIIINFLIVKVSGIPMLEKKYDKHPDFQNYKRKTNALIPWFSK
jgi:steroid 5-alpha reductase family enzyme